MAITIDEREFPLVRVDYDGPMLLADHDRFVAGWASVVTAADAAAVDRGKHAGMRSRMPFPQGFVTDVDQASEWAAARLAAATPTQ